MSKPVPGSNRQTPASSGRVFAAFVAVYIIWGSTYLAIRYAVETIPPFLMASARFLVSGLFLYTFSRWRGAPRPSLSSWKKTAIVGGLLLVGGNGALVWAEQTVPSGLAALIVAILPFWIVILEWILPGRKKPGAGIVAGLVMGIIGLGILLGPAALDKGSDVGLVGPVILIIGSLSWALGSLYSRRVKMPPPLLATGMEMLAGGAILLVFSVLFGETTRFDPAAVSAASLLGLVYLTTFGSLLAFTAYVFLLEHVPATRVSTYAYVNPVVAVFLGWFIASEPITPRTLIAAAVILGAVALITTARIDSDAPAA